MQPQENSPKDKMLKIICWDSCACAQAGARRPSGFESNLENTQANCLFSGRKLTYFNTFTFLSFFFLFDPTLVVFTRLFRCAFFLLTPVMSTTKHEEIKITRRSLRDWLRKSTEHKSVQIPTFSPDRRKWRQGSLLQGKEIDFKSLNFWCKPTKMESRDGKGSRLSSGSQRQSSEFYAGDSTINYIWQVF